MTALTDTGRGRITLPIKDLAIHSANPRTDAGDVEDLAASIREHGVLAPLVVAKENGHIGVVDGSRRLAAAKLAGLTEVPVTFLTDDDAQVAALVLNLKRLDLNPLEEAEGYRKWLDLTGKNQRDLAAAVGKDESTISNALRLLKAPAPLKAALREESLGGAHARELMRLADESLFGKVKLKMGTTVRELQNQVESLNHDWQNAGPGAHARARAFLEEQRAKHPKATFTWEKTSQGYGRGELDLVEALGKPTVTKVGDVHSVKQHDTACSCYAFEIEPRLEYASTWDQDGEDRFDLKSFELLRVCVDRAGYAKYSASTRHSSSASSYTPRRKSPAELRKERQRRQREFSENIARHVTGSGDYRAHNPSPDLLKKFTAGGYTSDKAARLVLLSYATERVYTAAEMPEIVRKVLALKPAQVRELVLKRAAARVHSNVTARHGGHDTPFDRRVAAHELLTAYGVKSTPPERKAKKKAKR